MTAGLLEAGQTWPAGAGVGREGGTAQRDGGPPHRWRHDEYGHEDGYAVTCAAHCGQP
jgi:hypothetical protein